jgi:hypothetical protein
MAPIQFAATGGMRMTCGDDRRCALPADYRESGAHRGQWPTQKKLPTATTAAGMELEERKMWQKRMERRRPQAGGPDIFFSRIFLSWFALPFALPTATTN